MTVAQQEGPPISGFDDDTHPVVPLPRAGLSAVAIVAACAVLAVVLFVVLDNGRRAREMRGAKSISMEGAISAPAQLQLPADAVLVDPRPPVVAVEERAPPPRPRLVQPMPQTWAPPSSYFQNPLTPIAPQIAPAPAPVDSARSDGVQDPVLILDTGTGTAAVVGSGKSGENQDAVASDDTAVRATRIRNRTTLVPQGAIINAVLETPIDSTRSGLVRAVVSRDARGFDGTRVLIPRGSRLIGQAEGDAKPGQHRVLVEWTRLIRPDGVAIRIGSPASDTLGGAGISGSVNNHFLARFANAALQSALTAGVAIAARSSDSSYIYALPGPIMGAGQSLFPDVPPGATIKVRAGAAIAVFVARDLDFSGTTGAR